MIGLSAFSSSRLSDLANQALFCVNTMPKVCYASRLPAASKNACDLSVRLARAIIASLGRHRVSVIVRLTLFVIIGVCSTFVMNCLM